MRTITCPGCNTANIYPNMLKKNQLEASIKSLLSGESQTTTCRSCKELIVFSIEPPEINLSSQIGNTL